MKKRKAFKLTWALVPYNLAMACLNAYIAIQVGTTSCHARKYPAEHLSFLFTLFIHFHWKARFRCYWYLYLVSFAVVCSFYEITV